MRRPENAIRRRKRVQGYRHEGGIEGLNACIEAAKSQSFIPAEGFPAAIPLMKPRNLPFVPDAGVGEHRRVDSSPGTALSALQAATTDTSLGWIACLRRIMNGSVEVVLLKMSGHSQSSRERANAIFDSIRL